jgi:hypothetical protein
MTRWQRGARRLLGLVCAATGLAGTAPPPASAQDGHPQPTGPSVRADTLAAAVAGVDVAWRCLEDVTMVVWAADPSVGDDQDGWSIQARLFRGGQPLGGQRQVNRTTAGDQIAPSVEVDVDGNFVVAWYSSDHTLRRRVYDHSTLGPGDEAAVALPDPEGVEFKGLHVESGGGTAVVWQEGDFLRGQRYDAAGAPVGSELEALWNLDPSLGGGVRSVLRTDDHEQLLGWGWFVVDANNGDEHSSIEVDRFSADGSPLGGFHIAYGYLVFVGEGQVVRNPRVASLPTGGFVVAYDLETWFEDSFSPDLEVRLSRFDAAGSAVFEREPVTPTLVEDYFPLVQEVAAEADDDLLLLWRGSGGELLGRRLASAAPPGDEPFQVADQALPSWPRPEAAAGYCRPSSPFVVAWTSGCDGADECVHVRWFRSYPDIHGDGFESGDLARWCRSEGD